MPFDIYILSFKDILDILLVAFLLYKSYKLMKSSGSINIFIGLLVFIFFNDTATTEIYTLSLHDALPECGGWF